MDHYLLQIIKDTTEFIESRILEDLNLDSISENVNISKFHLLRIWKGATATGLMEYVRRRRLALSLVDLIAKSSSIEFISDKFAFGCERSYNRAFKEEFGTTPAKWRRNPTALKILDRFNADFMSRAGEGLVFFKSVSILPSFSLAGTEHTLRHSENLQFQTANKAGVEFFYHGRPRIVSPVERDIYYGLSIPMEDPDLSFYLPSLQVNEDSIIPDDMKTRRIPAHTYGVFTYIGPHRSEEINSLCLMELWTFVQEKWMPTVQFDLRQAFHFERVNYARCNKQYCECDLYYPITDLENKKE